MWPNVTKVLKSLHITPELNLVEGSMSVRTTSNTYDPYAIIKARYFISLLSRSVPVQPASNIFKDEMSCDVIKINSLVDDKNKFIRRRQRLLGPNVSTIQALKLLTNTYILVKGNTCSVIGRFKDLKIVRRIVAECFNKVHPIYNIKSLMIKRELIKDPILANENWNRFLPKYKKKAPSNTKLCLVLFIFVLPRIILLIGILIGLCD
jgi:ribosomal RNA assembly protein